MDLRDYLAAIRRRYYVFFPILLAIVGVHVLWVTYGQRPLYEASSHIAVKPAIQEQGQLGRLSPSAWVRQPTPAAIKQAAEKPSVQVAMSELLSGSREFRLREFTYPPLDGEVEASVASLLSILEPLLLIFVGGLIGMIVISMYLPIFNLMQQF